MDSTVLIDYMRGNKKAVNLINKLYRSSWFFTTVINEYELKRGAPKHTKIINELLYNLNVLPMNRAAADTAAEIYNNLKKMGKPIDEPDYLIAGICLSNGIKTIVTQNKKHFEKIKGLKVIYY
ncbi:type II toxin-antitoxin system VapC family toxin [Candidatus Micrarchaeota archaeon]|nr:type II toxin-antitoxin system VapC family toxin [Candidatus Micrarchaeota archaeon]